MSLAQPGRRDFRSQNVMLRLAVDPAQCAREVIDVHSMGTKR
jgi:hypothetical protein